MDRDPKRFPIDHGDCYLSELAVLRSGAGWYIGRMCWDKKDEYEEPYSRESDYYEDREQAEKELKELSFPIRDCMENNAGYKNGRHSISRCRLTT